MRIHLDRARCAGNGLCEFETEKYFEVRDDGTLAVLQWEVDEGDQQKIRNAVAACPTEALSVSE